MDWTVGVMGLTILVALIMGGYAIAFHFAPRGIQVEGLGWFEVCRECGEILNDGHCPECDE